LVQNTYRTFTTTRTLSKKRPRDDPKEEDVPQKSGKGQVQGQDPFDMTALETSISETTTKLKDDLASLRTGGRLSPTAIEAIRVTIKGRNGSPDSSANLGDIAQVIKRGGRMLVVQVLDPDHVKPVNAALLAANLNLTPTPDPQNPSHLNLPLPPPTREHRLEAAKEVGNVGERAASKIRNARAGTHKKLQAMLKGKAVGPDDFKKAEKLMEKVVKGGLDEVKRLVDGTKGSILEG
jgi:ribosome recycling factor